MNLQTILLATDFSDRSVDAEDHALTLARACGASLLLVHGVEPIIGVEESDSDEFAEFYHRLMERAEQQVEARLDKWADEHVLVKHHVQIGERWKVVLEQAEQHDADLIVLGRRVFGDGRNVPLGTTSQKVFYGSRRPVLFVPVSE